MREEDKVLARGSNEGDGGDGGDGGDLGDGGDAEVTANSEPSVNFSGLYPIFRFGEGSDGEA
eukprot:4334440-Prymnesium_polylepis.2